MKFLPVSAIVLYAFCGLCHSQDAPNASPANVYSKKLSDGRSVYVEEFITKSHEEPKPGLQESLPPGYTAVGGDYIASRYVLHLREKSGNAVQAWEATDKRLIPGPQEFAPLKIYDVQENTDQLAILYSIERDVFVEVISKINGRYVPEQKYPILQQSSLQQLKEGTLSWKNGLEVLIKVMRDKPVDETWSLSNGSKSLVEKGN